MLIYFYGSIKLKHLYPKNIDKQSPLMWETHQEFNIFKENNENDVKMKEAIILPA